MGILFSCIPAVSLVKNSVRGSYLTEIRQIVFEKLLKLDIMFYDQEGSENIISKAEDGLESLGKIFYFLGNGDIFVSVPVSVGALFYLWSQDPIFSIGVLVIGILCFISKIYLGPIVEELYDQKYDIQRGLDISQREILENLTIVRTYQAEKDLVEDCKSKTKEISEKEGKIFGLELLLDIFSYNSGNFIMVMSLLILLPKVASGSLDSGGIMALIMYAHKVLQLIWIFQNKSSEESMMWKNIEGLIDLLEYQPVTIFSSPGINFQGLSQGIEISNLRFGYHDNLEILHNINLFLPSKIKIALVGPSGAGKSTFVKILMGLYPKFQGEIFVDGNFLSEYSEQSFYQQIGYVSQDVPLFSGTVRDNIIFGNKSKYRNDDQLLKIINQASAEFILNLPYRLDTKLGQAGTKLSGGEKQRLAIARLLFKNPSIIVLDEATASLDNITEKNIQTNFQILDEISGKKTWIVIAHRLSTVRDSDIILVLDNGRIVCTGNHEYLLDHCDLYKQLNFM